MIEFPTAKKVTGKFIYDELRKFYSGDLPDLPPESEIYFHFIKDEHWKTRIIYIFMKLLKKYSINFKLDQSKLNFKRKDEQKE